MTRRLRALEALYWILAVSGMVVLGLAVLAFVFGDGLLTLKYLLFVVGFLLFGVGSWSLWAGNRRRPTIWPNIDLGPAETEEIWFERRLWSLPGLRGEWLPPQDRVSRSIKLFLASLVVLGSSYLLEAAFGVAI
ncbi:MAG: hypothetical protein ABEJ84_06040 [Halodesulfurarchaeum sp.]